MPVVHELKTWPVYFDAVARGEKTFEVRRDDRGFQKGDIVRLRRWNTEWQGYDKTPPIECEIAWILTGGQHGVEPGYVVLALQATRPAKENEGHG
ncbi:DUF3850 domain-containing protein [Bosea sp. RCC_152_1]|uniref:DUF3850 domain-containing protein n=1 Tax=Bosea sp. RCC_152_1 TaxID=3239228 RepID=UPI0035238128